MELRILKKEEVENIYNNLMTKDFPDAELKPLDAILDMMDKGCYEPLGAYENGKLLGYAFMTKIPSEDYLLLDYLAVVSTERQKGLGQSIICNLKEKYKGKIIFIESENPDFQEGIDKEVAIKRLGFYEKNGVINSNVLSCIWTVHYINFYLADKNYSEEYCKDALNKIYEIMIPNKSTRDRMVKIG